MTLTTNNYLRKVLGAKSRFLAEHNIELSFPDAPAHGSDFADLDGVNYGGRITFWPFGKFEFQFHNHNSGEIMLLETREIRTEAELSRYLDKLIERMERMQGISDLSHNGK